MNRQDGSDGEDDLGLPTLVDNSQMFKSSNHLIRDLREPKSAYLRKEEQGLEALDSLLGVPNE